MPRRRFDLGLLALTLASAIGLGGCEALFFDPDDQPPFAVRNAFDEIAAPYIGLAGADYFDKELPLRTMPLLREALPPGTPLDRVESYFQGLGGSCRRGGLANGGTLCEYCTLKVERAGSYFSILTLRREILWQVELFDQVPFVPEGPRAMTVQAMSLRVLEGRRDALDPEDSGGVPPRDCRSARSRLPTSPTSLRPGKLWVYGEPESKD